MFDRILFVTPPFYRFLGSRNNWINLGIHYVASVLNQKGYNVHVYNADTNPNIKEPSLEMIFENSETFQDSVQTPDHFIWKDIALVIKAYNPDLLGLSLTLGNTRYITNKIIEIAKAINPNIEVIVGGPHATLAPDKTLSENKYIDYLIRHEGEYSILEFVEGKDVSQIRGLSYKKNGFTFHNPSRPLIENLDTLPFPDYSLELFPTNASENFKPIVTSRGCSFNCSYCASPILWQRHVRFRSVDNVLAEIIYRHDRYGVHELYFSDDNFNLNKTYTQALCQLIIKSNIDITWLCEVKFDLLDEKTLTLMKDAGCKRIKLGVESGSNRILKLLNKNTTVNQVRKAVRMIKKVGMPFTVYVMIGTPTETKKEILTTLKLCKELDPDWVSLSVVLAEYGTELYNMVQEMGLLPQDDKILFHQSFKSPLNKNVTRDMVYKFLELNEQHSRGFTEG